MVGAVHMGHAHGSVRRFVASLERDPLWLTWIYGGYWNPHKADDLRRGGPKREGGAYGRPGRHRAGPETR